MTPQSKRLLSVGDVRRIYGIGRFTAVRIMLAIPHVYIGKKLYVLSSDLEAFFEQATKNGLNITEYVKEVLANGGVNRPNKE